MQTAAIPYRVADFLKQHPPFQFLAEADLLALAARGRVKFHEPDEYICWQDAAHAPFVFVIQQGTVSLWDEHADPPLLRDVRGAGDLIGLERFHGAEASLYSAKSSTEVLLYALNAADFAAAIAKEPLAEQFIASDAHVTADYTPGTGQARADEVFAAELVHHRQPIICPSGASIAEAARLLSESGAPALAFTIPSEPPRCLTTSDILGWVASGASDATQPALALAVLAPVIGPTHHVSECTLLMAESGSAALALTADGQPTSPLVNLICASDFPTVYGDHPVDLASEIASANDRATLRRINQRARSWLLEQLTSPAALDWLAAWSDLINRRIVRRLAELEGWDARGALWCFYGASGRQEILTAASPRVAIIGTQAPGLETALADCGYLAPEPATALILDDWQARFTGWIREPLLNQVYQAYPFFDMRPVFGSDALFQNLAAHVRQTLADEPNFVRLAANDCLSSLPPLTFFRDLVIEDSGERTDTFRLQTSAQLPLASVARVFALASSSPIGGSTQSRLQNARRMLPAHEAIFREAADTMRIVLYHQARAGLRTNTTGAEIPLAFLSRHDRQVLKSAFRSLHRLLEFTASGDWLPNDPTIEPTIEKVL